MKPPSWWRREAAKRVGVDARPASKSSRPTWQRHWRARLRVIIPACLSPLAEPGDKKPPGVGRRICTMLGSRVAALAGRRCKRRTPTAGTASRCRCRLSHCDWHDARWHHSHTDRPAAQRSTPTAGASSRCRTLAGWRCNRSTPTAGTAMQAEVCVSPVCALQAALC